MFDDEKLFAFLEGLSGDTVLRAFTDYHGTQLLTKGFAQHLVDEGLATEEEVGITDGEEDDDEEE